MSVINVYHGNTWDGDVEPYNENPTPSVRSWDDALISRSRTVEVMVPRDCGDPMCEGCDICEEADTYEQRMIEVKQMCKARQGMSICTCQLCSMELSHPQNDEEEP